ncbi:MAG: IS1182 family transposase [Oscillospiraceae bacterium]|nr:IS1182 family transposase [Oscillospiraceae bacterium]
MKQNFTQLDFSPTQGVIPAFLTDYLDICDPVVVFDEIMRRIDLEKYLKPLEQKTGRPRYNPVRILKTILFGFMDGGYSSLRELEDRCRVDIRYKYLMAQEMPSYRTFGHFIEDFLEDNIEELFKIINEEIFKIEGTDLNHLYIDGSKFEANANKYSWVWKKASEKSRYKLYGKITILLESINTEIVPLGLEIKTRSEYVPEYLDEIISRYSEVMEINPETFVHGIGRRKTQKQRNYELLSKYRDKLSQYIEHIRISGEHRNSYSKTDPSATFFRMKRDYMGNDQLLPGYNIQIGVADEYIAVVDVQQYASDMDCFVPLMERFHKTYGFYPEYPVADAGYGSYNNYLYCEQTGMKKYMKFPVYEKVVKNEKFRNDPFRAVNFARDEEGNMICPNGRKMIFSHRKAVKGNKYGRQEEIYQCEDCSGCPYAEQCKRTDNNRTISLNEELSSFHAEVLENLESIQGAYLRMNRSIQAEGTFGVMKYDRWYKRTVRRGMKSVMMELFLVSIGHNLYKFYNKYITLRGTMQAV